MTDVASFIAENSGGVYPAFSFKAIGDTIKGEIAEPVKIVEHDNYSKTGKEQSLVIAVTTDDGDTFSVWARKQMLGAIGDAVKLATGGKTEMVVGARIAVRFAEERDTGKGNPLKVFTAQYQAPTSGVDVGSLL